MTCSATFWWPYFLIGPAALLVFLAGAHIRSKINKRYAMRRWEQTWADINRRYGKERT